KDQVVNSQVISDPIRLLDAFPIGDGAAALLLTSKEDFIQSSNPIELVTVYQATSLPINLRDDLLELPASKSLFGKVLNGYGLDLNDAVIEVHDSYSIFGYLIIEALGLVERGKAPEAIKDLDNVNLSGGLKARGHPVGATGIYQVAEVFKILTSGLGDVRRNSSWGLVHSMSAVDSNSSIAVLKRCE
ncbi:MAG: thiolase family protein, partial [Sulfolobales archaeon]